MGESRYIVDMGTQSIEQMATRGIPADSIRAIFFTHMHGDHTNGIISFLDLCSWKFKTAEPTLFWPCDTERVRELLSAWLLLNETEMRPFDFRRVAAGVIYDDGVLRVTAYATRHCRESYAYLLEAEGKRVIYTGDLSTNLRCNDFPMIAIEEPSDLLICKMAHFLMEHITPYLEQCQTKQLCFTHVSGREGRMQSIIDVKDNFAFPVLIVNDGDEIVI